MSNHLPITEADRAAWRAGKLEPQTDFAATLQETMAAVGATPAPAPAEQPVEIKPKLPVATYRQLFGALAFVAVALLIAWVAFRPDAAPAVPPTAAPAGASLALPTEAPAATEATATMLAYAAPEGAQLGPIDASATIEYQHSEYPQWGGVRWQGAIVWVKTHAIGQLLGLPDLARPTPKPTPVYVYVEPACDVATNPRYVAQIDVSDARGVPLGQASGASCDSQAEAQARAEAHAAEMREHAPPPCPTWPGPPFVKPDCGGN